MPSKEYRQRLIEELVENEFISTQSELAEHLAARGDQLGVNLGAKTITVDAGDSAKTIAARVNAESGVTGVLSSVRSTPWFWRVRQARRCSRRRAKMPS